MCRPSKQKGRVKNSSKTTEKAKNSCKSSCGHVISFKISDVPSLYRISPFEHDNKSTGMLVPSTDPDPKLDC